jgi:hypothetical protein
MSLGPTALAFKTRAPLPPRARMATGEHVDGAYPAESAMPVFYTHADDDMSSFHLPPRSPLVTEPGTDIVSFTGAPAVGHTVGSDMALFGPHVSAKTCTCTKFVTPKYTTMPMREWTENMVIHGGVPIKLFDMDAHGIPTAVIIKPHWRTPPGKDIAMPTLGIVHQNGSPVVDGVFHATMGQHDRELVWEPSDMTKHSLLRAMRTSSEYDPDAFLGFKVPTSDDSGSPHDYTIPEHVVTMKRAFDGMRTLAERDISAIDPETTVQIPIRAPVLSKICSDGYIANVLASGRAVNSMSVPLHAVLDEIKKKERALSTRVNYVTVYPRELGRLKPEFLADDVPMDERREAAREEVDKFIEHNAMLEGMTPDEYASVPVSMSIDYSAKVARPIEEADSSE